MTPLPEQGQFLLQLLKRSDAVSCVTSGKGTANPRAGMVASRLQSRRLAWIVGVAYNRGMKSLEPAKEQFLLTLARRVVPEVVELDERGLGHLTAIIDRALGDRPEEMRTKFATFLGVLRWAPMLRYGAPFDRLRPDRQDAVLRWFENAPVGLLRQGLWGLKSMVFMGYYGRAEAWDEIGYAPSFDSLERLRA